MNLHHDLFEMWKMNYFEMWKMRWKETQAERPECVAIMLQACDCGTAQQGGAFTMQHTAPHCNTLHHTATHCNTLSTCGYLRWAAARPASSKRHSITLQRTASRYNTLQYATTRCTRRTEDRLILRSRKEQQGGAFTLQHTATHCNTLQHTATHCNALQHTSTHCNTLQHTAAQTVSSKQ